MPPPLIPLGKTVVITTEIPVRLCLGKSFKKVKVPPGSYKIIEIWRDENFWHVSEMSDGYTYRIQAENRKNPYYGKRISVWQNDLCDGLAIEEE